MIKDMINQLMPSITAIRHKIHQQPELSFEERETAQIISDFLEPLGYKIINRIGKTGVVALLDTKVSGKTIAFRAEMDALPLVEQNDLSYQSQQPNVMHACGHDGHIAILLMTAALLVKYQDQLSGKIKLIFQPAEESGSGAVAMIKDGVLENPKIDAIFALHNVPGIALGKIALRDGCMMGSVDNFRIIIKGQGGHVSTPEKCIDPIVIGSSIIHNLQSIVTQLQSKDEPLTISITEFHAGSAMNTIPDEAIMVGTLRTTHKKTQERAKKMIDQMVQTTAQNRGAKAIINAIQSVIPTVNSSVEMELVKEVVTDLFGKDNIIELASPYLAYDDFAYFLNQIPGCYFFIGAGENTPMLHTSEYNFNDAIILMAASVFFNLVHKLSAKFRECDI